MPSPNILLVVTDQQRAETVAPSSQCQMPTVEGLGSDGIRFSRCYSQNSICSPSRASLLTGTLPHTHGMVDCTHALPEYIAQYQSDLDTWSRALSRQGYYLGYAGKWHVERSGDPGQFGFDEQAGLGEIATEEGGLYGYDRSLSESAYGTDTDRHLERGDPGLDGTDLTTAYVNQGKGYSDDLVYGTHDAPVSAELDYGVFERGVEFIHSRADSDSPWGFVVAPVHPHDPYVAPDSYAEQYDPGSIELPGSFDDSLADKPAIYGEQASVHDDMTREHFREALARYYALCSFLDDQVARLLDALRETDQLENTIVVYTSDHGDLLGSHRLLAKGAPAFEEAYNVPLIINDFRDQPGDSGACDHIVSLYDLAPTIAEWGGGTLDGGSATSLAPLLDGAEPPGPEEAYAEFHSQRLQMTQRILWRDRYKYVYHGAAEDELYDLERDPGERDNLLAGPGSEYGQVAEEMAARVWEYCHETGDDTLANANYTMYRFAPVGPEPRE